LCSRLHFVQFHFRGAEKSNRFRRRGYQLFFPNVSYSLSSIPNASRGVLCPKGFPNMVRLLLPFSKEKNPTDYFLYHLFQCVNRIPTARYFFRLIFRSRQILIHCKTHRRFYCMQSLWLRHNARQSGPAESYVCL